MNTVTRDVNEMDDDNYGKRWEYRTFCSLHTEPDWTLNTSTTLLATAHERRHLRRSNASNPTELCRRICSTRLNDGFPIQDGANSLIRVVSAS